MPHGRTVPFPEFSAEFPSLSSNEAVFWLTWPRCLEETRWRWWKPGGPVTRKWGSEAGESQRHVQHRRRACPNLISDLYTAINSPKPFTAPRASACVRWSAGVLSGRVHAEKLDALRVPVKTHAGVKDQRPDVRDEEILRLVFLDVLEFQLRKLLRRDTETLLLLNKKCWWNKRILTVIKAC